MNMKTLYTFDLQHLLTLPQILWKKGQASGQARPVLDRARSMEQVWRVVATQTEESVLASFFSASFSLASCSRRNVRSVSARSATSVIFVRSPCFSAFSDSARQPAPTPGTVSHAQIKENIN